jgi:hypothetical protein
MAEIFEGSVSITTNGTSDEIILLDAQNGNAVIGSSGKNGNINLQDASGNVRITLSASQNTIKISNSAGEELASLGSNGNLVLGGQGSDGDITLKDNADRTRLSMSGDSHEMRMYSAEGNRVIQLGSNGNLTLGGIGMDGDLGLRDSSNRERINLDGDNQRLRIRDADGNQVVVLGPNGNLTLGGAGGHDGDLALLDGAGVNRINFDAQNHRMILRDDTGHEFGRLGDYGNLKLGSGGHDGDILLYPSSAADMSRNEDATIHLDANAGDITLRNADCAEEFQIAEEVSATPGTVMSLGPDGQLRPSGKALDKTVVGVISGAGGYKPGIVLDRQPDQESRQPIALMGKTFVQVCDEGGPIEMGDLLTTSSVAGTAMRAPDGMQAFGSVIGKAFDAHQQGNGMIPMIIVLQ